MGKRKITLTAIILAVVLIALFGSTYAYFTSNTTPQSSLDATITTGALSLILDDVDGITEEDKIDANHTEIVKYFSITNNGTQDAYAKLIFKGITNTFVRDDLVYELEEVQADKTSFSPKKIELSETVVPKSSTPSNQILADSILIEKGTITNNTVTPNTKYYKLTVKYKYSDTVNQNEDLGATLVSGFTIEEGTYQTRLLTTNGVEMRLDNSNISTTISPNGSIQKTFRLRNNTNTTQKVDVELTNISNTNTNMTASLIKDGTVIVDNITIPVGNNETVALKKGVEIPSNDNSTYTIIINNTDTNSSNINANVNSKKSASAIACIDASGNEITCPATFTMGDRIAIGEGANRQTFRYLRTTSTSSNLSECGTRSSVACADSTNGVHRFLAEYNLKRTGTVSSSTAIAADALQDPSDAPDANGVQYSTSNNDYNYSWVKIYMTNYQKVLNTLIGTANAVTVNALSKAEAESLFGCPSGTSTGACSNIPDWAHNSHYWLGSASPDIYVWYVHNNGSLRDYVQFSSSNSGCGARAVVNIPASYFE